MKKLILISSAIVLLAAGCGSTASNSAPTGQSNNAPAQSPAANRGTNPNKSLSSCEALISLDQLKTILNDTNIVLTKFSKISNGSSDNTSAIAVCQYGNSGVTGTDFKSPGSTIINGMITVYNYTPQNYNILKSEFTSGFTQVSGLGSQAFHALAYGSAYTYMVASSNNKYIFMTAFNIGAPNFDVSKEDQVDLSIAKIVDANLNNY